MAKLEHTRHEMFCNFIARGNTAVNAYVAAGYPRNVEAAEALKAFPSISARIAELTPTPGKRRAANGST